MVPNVFSIVSSSVSVIGSAPPSSVARAAASSRSRFDWAMPSSMSAVMETCWTSASASRATIAFTMPVTIRADA